MDIWNEIPDHAPNNNSLVIVMLTDQRNAHTHKLQKEWPTIKSKLHQYDPTLKLVIYTVQRWDSTIDNRLPQSLKQFCKRWYPMIVAIPELYWNLAMVDSQYDLMTHSFIINGEVIDNKIMLKLSYNLSKSEDWVAWLKSLK